MVTILSTTGEIKVTNAIGYGLAVAIRSNQEYMTMTGEARSTVFISNWQLIEDMEDTVGCECDNPNCMNRASGEALQLFVRERMNEKLMYLPDFYYDMSNSDVNFYMHKLVNFINAGIDLEDAVFCLDCVARFHNEVLQNKKRDGTKNNKKA